jgi:hypothetical protein
MTLDQIVERYIAGQCGEVAGLNVHDAVHVLASVHQLSKPELRAAIYKAMEPKDEDDAPEPEQELEWWVNSSIEGADA